MPVTVSPSLHRCYYFYGGLHVVYNLKIVTRIVLHDVILLDFLHYLPDYLDYTGHLDFC